MTLTWVTTKDAECRLSSFINFDTLFVCCSTHFIINFQVHFRECHWKLITDNKLAIIPVFLIFELCHRPFYNSLLHLMNSLYTDRQWKKGLSIYLATYFIHNVLQFKYMFHDIFCGNSWPAMLIFWIGQQWHKHL